MPRFATTYESPLGSLLLLSDGKSLTEILLDPPSANDLPKETIWDSSKEPFPMVRQQLDEYFQLKRQSFDLPINPSGTSFQQSVWAELSRIPFGQTVSYGTVAKLLGDAKLARAVGMANGRNPLPIVVPCHRVIGADGTLTGYSGGLHVKTFLLRLEASSQI